MPGKVRDASDVGFDGVRRSVAYTQVVDHALTKSSHGKLLSERKCSFGDKHYALLKGAFYFAKNGKDEVENLQQCSAAYRVAVLSNRHYVRREKANGRQARMTSLFDVGCAARLRNARLSDDRPIRQFILKAYTIGSLEKHLLCFWFFGLMEEFWAIDRRVKKVSHSPKTWGCRVLNFQVRSTYGAWKPPSFTGEVRNSKTFDNAEV